MEKVDMPMMNRAISKPASALKFDFVKENRKHLMKKDAQIAALTAPEALPATNVSDVGFVANWNTVSGANYYSVQTYRHFTTTQDVDYISLYEDFYFAEAAPEEFTNYLDGYTYRRNWILLYGKAEIIMRKNCFRHVIVTRCSLQRLMNANRLPFL